MKQVKRSVKPSDAETAASFLFENGIQTIMSWKEENFLESDKIVLILAVPETVYELFNLQKIFSK